MIKLGLKKMKIKRQKNSKKGLIEIIPMIDVMFFLLATFILASLAVQKINGIAVNLPQGKADKIEVEEKITISIDAKNQIYLNKNLILLNDLESQLRTLINNKDKNIIINSDQDAKQGVVMQAMLLAKKAGAKHFSLISRE